MEIELLAIRIGYYEDPKPITMISTTHNMYPKGFIIGNQAINHHIGWPKGLKAVIWGINHMWRIFQGPQRRNPQIWLGINLKED